MNYDMLIRRSRKQPEEEAKVPLPYIQANAIHTTDTYMSMDLNVSTADEWEITCARDNDSKGNLPVIGTGNSKTDSNMALWLNCSTNLVEFTFGDGGNSAYKVTTTAYDVKQFHTYRMKLGTGEAWLDGNYIGKAQSVSSIPHPKNLVLFGCWRGNAILSKFYGAVKECIIRRNGEIIRHYVPADYHTISGGSVGLQTCMYDLANNTATDIAGTLWHKYYANWDVEIGNAKTYAIATFLHFGTASIDWGDGNNETISTIGYKQTSHTYTDSGTFSPTISMDYSNRFLSLTALVSIDVGNNATVKRINKFISHGDIPENFLNSARALQQPFLPPCARIDDSAFLGASLTNTILPPTVRAIESNAFRGSNYNNILPDGLEIIDSYAFLQDASMDIHDVPASVKYIGTQAFFDTGLTNLTFHGTPDYISQSALYATGLKAIYVPWEEGEVADAPWGAINATIVYGNPPSATYNRASWVAGNYLRPVDTGITVDWSKTLEVEAIVKINAEGRNLILGNYEPNLNTKVLNLELTADAKFRLYGDGFDHTLDGFTAEQNTIYTLKYFGSAGAREVTLTAIAPDGTTYTQQFSKNTDTQAGGQSLAIFKDYRTNASTTFKQFLWVYRMRIWQDGVPIRYYVPAVRKADTKPGLYDLCNSISTSTDSPLYIGTRAGYDLFWG